MTPRYLTTCPCCGVAPQWKHEGTQPLPAKYREPPRFASELEMGNMVWLNDDEFGYELFTCDQCGTTASDTR